MVNIIELYKDYNITYWTFDKNVKRGWVNIKCPMCGDKSNHLGFNLSAQYYNCWKCGYSSIEDILKEILSMSYAEVKELLDEYRQQ